MINKLIENKINKIDNKQYAAIIGFNPSKTARSPKLWNAVFKHYKKNIKMYPLDVKKKTFWIKKGIWGNLLSRSSSKIG